MFEAVVERAVALLDEPSKAANKTRAANKR
jgi:hypothetical protein